MPVSLNNLFVYMHLLICVNNDNFLALILVWQCDLQWNTVGLRDCPVSGVQMIWTLGTGLSRKSLILLIAYHIHRYDIYVYDKQPIEFWILAKILKQNLQNPSWILVKFSQHLFLISRSNSPVLPVRSRGKMPCSPNVSMSSAWTVCEHDTKHASANVQNAMLHLVQMTIIVFS